LICWLLLIYDGDFGGPLLGHLDLEGFIADLLVRLLPQLDLANLCVYCSHCTLFLWGILNEKCRLRVDQRLLLFLIGLWLRCILVIDGWEENALGATRAGLVCEKTGWQLLVSRPFYNKLLGLRGCRCILILDLCEMMVYH
jgi:hypothetical protein